MMRQEDRKGCRCVVLRILLVRHCRESVEKVAKIEPPFELWLSLRENQVNLGLVQSPVKKIGALPGELGKVGVI